MEPCKAPMLHQVTNSLLLSSWVAFWLTLAVDSEYSLILLIQLTTNAVHDIVHAHIIISYILLCTSKNSHDKITPTDGCLPTYSTYKHFPATTQTFNTVKITQIGISVNVYVQSIT